MELEITWNRAVRVWWSYLWRNLIAIIVGLLIGIVVGAIVGFILGAMGVPVRAIQIIVAPIGFVIGLAISVVPLKMILGKDFGEFRLVLLAKQPQTTQPSTAPAMIQ
jgi:ABC-type glycerol-3-phosphate transport system permease component